MQTTSRCPACNASVEITDWHRPHLADHVVGTGACDCGNGGVVTCFPLAEFVQHRPDLPPPRLSWLEWLRAWLPWLDRWAASREYDRLVSIAATGRPIESSELRSVQQRAGRNCDRWAADVAARQFLEGV